MSHFLVLRLLSNMVSPYDLQRRTAQLRKGFAGIVNGYAGKEWNKAIHNGLTLPLVLTWYCHASQNSKMAAEVFPRITS